MSATFPELNLDKQLCFSLYAASRQVTRLYQPLLKRHDITYPQYIVLLILWQNDGLTVKDIGHQSQLKSNTLTPLLKRLEQNELVVRKRAKDDERQCHIFLTDKGKVLERECACIPREMMDQTEMSVEKLLQLKALLDEFLHLQEKHGE